MTSSLTNLVGEVLGRAPEWVRAEMAAKDPAGRRRAEETLAAMIAAALHRDGWRTFNNSVAAVSIDHLSIDVCEPD